jgi:RNA polymerase sigma factor (sigma-70 family)
VRRYQEPAFRCAYLVLRDADEAADAAQEAFVKAYYALPRFRTGAPFRPWFLRIVVNEARNRQKARHRRLNLALRAVGSRPSLTHDMPHPEDDVLLAEQRQALLEAVNRLREEDRLIIAYRYFLDLSEAEMAEALRRPRGTVKSRLSRALQRLKAVLATMETEPRRFPHVPQEPSLDTPA